MCCDVWRTTETMAKTCVLRSGLFTNTKVCNRPAAASQQLADFFSFLQQHCVLTMRPFSSHGLPSGQVLKMSTEVMQGKPQLLHLKHNILSIRISGILSQVSLKSYLILFFVMGQSVLHLCGRAFSNHVAVQKSWFCWVWHRSMNWPLSILKED